MVPKSGWLFNYLKNVKLQILPYRLVAELSKKGTGGTEC